ncbi:endo-1,4-beta-xylanase [Microvirga sp. GCM10011540]|uniref:endo-1,4-beta-xylanase n=1 Tax=Microvirga sp. GCM10011540 TaxID=3317338 RepID=UPI003611C160
MEPLKLETDSLRDAAAHRHLLYGTALCTSDLTEKRRCDTILRECSIITPEYEMKWDRIGGADAPDFRASDRLVAFAVENGLAFHGHTLWWHESVPQDLGEASDARFAEAAMEHLTRVVRRYAGRVYSWDVVNEPLETDHGRRDGLRHSRFLRAFGPTYLEVAFGRAAEIDPEAVLVLNEMGLEYASPGAERKRRAMLALLERALARGAPIHCLGIQSHLDAADQPRRHPELRAFLREIDGLGLKVMITEMDVSDQNCPRDRRLRDGMVADTYRAYLELVLEESRSLGVSTWGLSDDRTWLATARKRPDGAAVRPMLLDRALRRKPAWHAVKSALLSARNPDGGVEPAFPKGKIN